MADFITVLATSITEYVTAAIVEPTAVEGVLNRLAQEERGRERGKKDTLNQSGEREREEGREGGRERESLTCLSCELSPLHVPSKNCARYASGAASAATDTPNRTIPDTPKEIIYWLELRHNPEFEIDFACVSFWFSVPHLLHYRHRRTLTHGPFCGTLKHSF